MKKNAGGNYEGYIKDLMDELDVGRYQFVQPSDNKYGKTLGLFCTRCFESLICAISVFAILIIFLSLVMKALRNLMGNGMVWLEWYKTEMPI